MPQKSTSNYLDRILEGDFRHGQRGQVALQTCGSRRRGSVRGGTPNHGNAAAGGTPAAGNAPAVAAEGALPARDPLTVRPRPDHADAVKMLDDAVHDAYTNQSNAARTAPAAPIPRGPKPVTGATPGSYIDEAVAQQGLPKAPAGGLKQKWSEGGFDYEVRVHPADPAHGKTGSIYRVARRSQARDAHGQGTGLEYMDSTGKWHPESTLKPGKPGNPNPTFNDAAAKDTHIQLPPDAPPP